MLKGCLFVFVAIPLASFVASIMTRVIVGSNALFSGPETTINSLSFGPCVFWESGLF